MYRFTVQLFGITLFALALIWFADPGDASQITSNRLEPVLWADTIHIDLNKENPAVEIAPTDDRDSFLRNVKKLTQTAFNIRSHYMEDVDVKKMIEAGVEGMLSELDRYSVLMEPEAYDALMESTHGKYQGLGMQIDERDDRIVIISPIEGTPAYRKGLRAGDVITSIDGHDTEGMPSSEAVHLMRGEAGTSVTLVIKRVGIDYPMEFELERAVIELKSVNYYGKLQGTNIGYVRLSRFAEETSRELREAVSALNEQDVSSMILDLRSNGGGLLDQAKETSELFLNEGREIVYTKGRSANSERHYLSERPPLFPEEKPMIVLVDEGTASASEIVAGAIQDWDRGLLVGSTTYGKGLVQQIFPISADGDEALKLTTARYYVPSGRCIQKPERQSKHPAYPDLDTVETGDSLVVAQKDVFYTNGGRVVYGGGGIAPDVDVERETWKPIEINLERKSLFFDFAVQYVAAHPDIKADFEVTDEILAEFRQFIKSKDFTYKSVLQNALDDLRKTITEEDKEQIFDNSLTQMDALVQAEKDADFDRSSDYIRRAIKREIVSSVYGERGVYENVLFKSDKTLLKAVEILSHEGEYSRLMNEGKKKAEL
jgi:carboxyl-terminal processing protease